MFMLIILRDVASGILSSTWPFLGTTKNMFFNIFEFHCDTLENSGFSGDFGVFYELGQDDLLYTLWGHNMSMKHPMGPACVGYTPGPPENQMPP